MGTHCMLCVPPFSPSAFFGREIRPDGDKMKIKRKILKQAFRKPADRLNSTTTHQNNQPNPRPSLWKKSSASDVCTAHKVCKHCLTVTCTCDRYWGYWVHTRGTHRRSVCPGNKLTSAVGQEPTFGKMSFTHTTLPFPALQKTLTLGWG